MKAVFRDIELFVAIALCFILTFCGCRETHEVEQGASHESENTWRESNSTDSPANSQETEEVYEFPNFDNQISDVVRTVYQDSKSNVWFGAQGGVFEYDGKSLIHLDSVQSESGQNVTIKAIAESKDGRIWFGHTDGLSVFDSTTVTNYYESDGLLSNDVWSLACDKDNQIWIGTIKGLCTFDGKDFVPFEIPKGELDTTVGVSSPEMIHSIMEDSRGRMWFSTNGGAYILDGDALENISEENGFSTNLVNEVIEAQDGSFWISTSKGLFNLEGKTLIDITESVFEESKGTGSISEDFQGNLWFNCARSIYRLNGEELKEYRIAAGNYGPLTFQIYEDRQKRLWFVGYGGAFRFEKEEFVNITRDGPW